VAGLTRESGGGLDLCFTVPVCRVLCAGFVRSERALFIQHIIHYPLELADSHREQVLLGAFTDVLSKPQ